MKQKLNILENLHLIISTIIVVPVAFAYGINPASILHYYFDFEVKTIDLSNIFRAIMFLYLCIAIIWLFGILKSRFWFTATILNIAFMSGLALGRILSFILDGVPSLPFIIGLFGEMILAVFSIYQLNKYKHKKSSF
ncbi:DUF4345 family protein [Winogradskyella sp. 3972H.M.0a.05]|uniref:DUF4345 domain-containing protein n=1 Tax=Winogradskyella sp. 3972H.M.0a.05 TaxID=2950277 RepID=UPI0033968776